MLKDFHKVNLFYYKHRCYFCVEVCPYGALFTADPLTGRMVRQLKGRTVEAIDRLGSGKRTG